ncbi:cytochrome b/b6 domain-containing protein [Afifella sp. JA880]|uniref:cytochrome b n=1 Tax=Afifella sp. JA880 TaxID=2975280 RepID=UPI0021BAA03E|nr:cytochrome b/b6 domain-containing protein [Afifella sp. JA880]MCT8267588.1 cytochrome b/b6 domain-containing protein [Afifella sp. JA880]
MQVEDTRSGYGALSLAIHWLAAAGIIALWLLGNQMEDLARGPARTAALDLHVSVGVVLFVILAARVLWRLFSTLPDSPDGPPALRIFSRAVQVGLLLCLTILIISGPMTIWTAGRPLPVFGLFAISSPLTENHSLHEVFETVHVVTSKVILVLFLVHVLGALKLWVTRPSLLRMVAPGR